MMLQCNVPCIKRSASWSHGLHYLIYTNLYVLLLSTPSSSASSSSSSPSSSSSFYLLSLYHLLLLLIIFIIIPSGLRQLSSMPTTSEILRASDCQRCRVYFKKTGPVCAHCHLEDVIVAYRLKLIAFKSKRKVLVSLARPGAATTGEVVPAKGNKKGASKDKEREKGASAGHVLGHGVVEDEGEVQVVFVTHRSQRRCATNAPSDRESR